MSPEHAFYLPVPEKSQAQYNYILFPHNSFLPNRTPTATDLEPLVFTVPATAPKPGSVNGTMAAAAAGVSGHLRQPLPLGADHPHAIRRQQDDPDRVLGCQGLPQRSTQRLSAQREGRARQGVPRQQGRVPFFLPTGILWGFKKPLLFLPLDKIAAVSYTNVLQRTFNVVVELEANADGKVEELEFAMLDQEDYQGINETYVSRHGLADRSMAEQRKAKRELAENAKKGAGDGEADAVGEDDMTELQRAQLEAEQQLQDDEDEEEEDYEPGSEGDSEGSGESSEEDGDDDDQEDEDEDEEERVNGRRRE